MITMATVAVAQFVCDGRNTEGYLFAVEKDAVELCDVFCKLM